MVASDGGVFAFGNAGYIGSVPGQGITSPVPLVGISPSPDGQGYWLAASDGSLYSYGDATFLGSLSGLSLAAPVVGLAAPKPRSLAFEPRHHRPGRSRPQ